MNISPISFKGTVTIKTRENYHLPWKTEVIKTTPKQDAALLKAATHDMISNGHKFSDEVYANDTKNIHDELEKVAGHEIAQVSGFSKFLYLGGNYGDGLHTVVNPYDTTYNKIYYRDQGFLPSFAPRSQVIIDLMEPKERFDAAMESLSSLQTKVHKMFTASKNDERLNVFTPDKTKLSEDKYAHLEEVLEKTNAILAGGERGPSGLHKYPSAHLAYEDLVEALTKAMGVPYSYKHSDEICLGELSTQDMNRVSSAVAYLNATRH